MLCCWWLCLLTDSVSFLLQCSVPALCSGHDHTLSAGGRAAWVRPPRARHPPRSEFHVREASALRLLVPHPSRGAWLIVRTGIALQGISWISGQVTLRGRLAAWRIRGGGSYGVLLYVLPQVMLPSLEGWSSPLPCDPAPLRCLGTFLYTR